jgi:hypothetical protein
VALPFTLKSILRQKKNYRNSNISQCKNIVFKKSSKRNKNLGARFYNIVISIERVELLASNMTKRTQRKIKCEPFYFPIFLI